MQELENRICEKKYTQLPNNINKILQGLIQKCLMKKAEQRPTIEELVMMPEFQ